MVFVLPVFFKLTPVFCKYLCPAGTLAGILLFLSDSSLFAVLGKLFTWKLSVFLIIVFTAVMIYRPFCKYLCPLGAFYAPFNRISLVQLHVDQDACIHCKKCEKECDMCVDPVKNPTDLECIRCGKCVSQCPANAICISVKKISELEFPLWKQKRDNVSFDRDTLSLLLLHRKVLQTLF